MNARTAAALNKKYQNEKDPMVKERMLLIKRVMIDGKIPSYVANEEIGRAKAWAYKWLARFRSEGVDGLYDKQRSGRPSGISEKALVQIRNRMDRSKRGWNVNEVMELIDTKIGIKYHEVHVYRLMHKWGYEPRIAAKWSKTGPPKKSKWFKKPEKKRRTRD